MTRKKMCCLLFSMKCVKVFSLALAGWYCSLTAMNLVRMSEPRLESVGVRMPSSSVDWDIDAKLPFLFIISCVADARRRPFSDLDNLLKQCLRFEKKTSLRALIKIFILRQTKLKILPVLAPDFYIHKSVKLLIYPFFFSLLLGRHFRLPG